MLKVGFINASSLKLHINQFRQILIDDPTYDIMGVAESRLGQIVDDHIVHVDGYSIMRQDRNTEGGGVILYVRNSLRVSILANSDTTTLGKPMKPEYLMCCVRGEEVPPVLICLLYRPPDVSFNADPDLFTNLRDLCSSYSHKIIMGDLNADLLLDNSKSDFVKRLFNELSLQVINHEATNRPSGSKETKIWSDVIFVDNNDKVLAFNNKVPPFHNSHNFIDVQIQLHVPKPRTEIFTYRKYNQIIPEAINEYLSVCDWTPFLSKSLDVDNSLECLNIQKAIDHLAPLKLVNPKKVNQPWISKELQLLINKRKATEKRYLRTKNVIFIDELLKLTDEIEERTNAARNNFYREQITNTLDNQQDIWKKMRYLGLLPSPKKDLHGFSLNELNSHFTGVSFSQSENLRDVEELIATATDDGFKFHDVTLNDVILAVAHFKSQAMGADSIPQKVIAKSLPTIGPFLVKFYNSSLLKGAFPTAWKKSLLIAIKKKTSPTTATDFRPIALLCFLSKVMEKLAHDQIWSFLSSGNVLDPMQTGFKRYISTETALLKRTEDIRRGMNNRLITILLQFDFSKAFDTISPSKLLS